MAVTESVEESSGVLQSARAGLRETGASLRSVFANPSLRRLQLGLAGSLIGDWAYATAVAVWAYGVGGATAVGVWSAIRLGLMATTSPFTAALADRFPRKRVMVLADLGSALGIAGAAACVALDTHPAPVFVLATMVSLLGTPFRAARHSLTPALARTPEELTASNGTASTFESLAFFVGPALGAGLLTIGSVQAVFLVNAATFLWSMAMISRIVVPVADKPLPESDAGETPAEGEPEKPGFLAETSAGFRAIWRDKDLLLVIGQVAAQTIVAGASAVYVVVIAVDVLESGPKGVGYLDSVLGAGALVGGLFALSRASKRKLAQDMTLGVVLWSLPLLLITAWPSPVAAFVAMVFLGFANPLVDVNLDTIVQRITPDEVLGRVFGALETCAVATMALGAAVTPLLVHLVGLRATLAILGGSVTLLALAGLPRMLRLDRRLVPPRGLDLLDGIALFGPLAFSVRDSLARSLVPVHAAAGDVVVREGADSDRFFVIESGTVEVTSNGRVLRHERPGDFFGEIGLLRAVPRTATVTATEDTVLLTLSREDFLGAVTGVREAHAAAEDIVRRRLAI